MSSRKIHTNPPIEINDRAWFFIKLLKEYKPELISDTMVNIKADVQRVIYERGGLVGEHLNIVAQKRILNHMSNAVIDDATQKYIESFKECSKADQLAFKEFFRQAIEWRVVSNSWNMQFIIFGNLIMDLNDIGCAIEMAINSEISQNQTTHSAQ